ncbi:protein DEFECTIVE IN MERISTEM SILENCING 3-like [Tripterygium wilfordii]|uniref:Protein DEFECTIVE IN MERISTEM SILENCING 3-like n=1 Tax=Tripterygium wilfordii TaxID=458696 RepID=A0A7J7DB14_TRIWF|nr:protein DEFECTIVE IN MERISTEM SILENCING 3-like [Tripterygium wilfordii]
MDYGEQDNDGSPDTYDDQTFDGEEMDDEEQLPTDANPLSVQKSSPLMEMDKNDQSIVLRDETQNGGFSQAQSIIYSSKKRQDDLHMLGLKIKQHEDNIKFLKTQRNKLDESILDLQVILGKYHASSTFTIANEDHSAHQSEDETNQQIILHEKSAASILCQLNTRHGTLAYHLLMTRDVLGVVATLGKVDDDNLNRLFSEYLGLDTMLAIVCKTLEGVKALEVYEKDGHINKGSGLHGLGASIGRALEGRFRVISLENLRPYCGEFVADDPQRRLDLLKPKLPNGECPPGFLGFAVNMIKVEGANLFCVTTSGYGLRETLFYNLFSCLQVYRTREDMLHALPFINDGAISLDGGMVRNTGSFSLGNRVDVDVRFPKASKTSNVSESYAQTEKKMSEIKWEKEKLTEDIKREQALLANAQSSFEKQKQEFVMFLAQSSSHATQVLAYGF